MSAFRCGQNCILILSLSDALSVRNCFSSLPFEDASYLFQVYVLLSRKYE